MRKDRKQQKRINADQLDLFSVESTPTGGTNGRTGGDNRIGADLSSLLEKQRTLTANLLNRIVDYENLTRAYKQVKRNSGSSGVDQMETEALG